MAGKTSSKQTEIRAQHNLFGDTPAELDLQLRVTDQEVIQELLQREPGAERDHFATSALRVGVLAFRQASGLIDRSAMRSEGDRNFTYLSSESRFLNASSFPGAT